MVLSNEIQTDIKINEALAELFDRQKINMQGANAAVTIIAQSEHSQNEKAKRLAEVEKAVAADQCWFQSTLEDLAMRFGAERVGRVMRTGIDISEYTTH